MSEYNYDSYCGIYCGACDIHVAYVTGQKSRFASFFTERTLKALLAPRGISFKQGDLRLACHGCKSGTVFINCSDCPIRACAVDKHVEHCIECGQYPCSIIQNRRKLEGVLPHLTTNHANMETIKKTGTEGWLTEQAEHWKCPKCKTRFAWYTETCSSCGADVRSRAFKYSRIKAALMKAAIHVFSIVRTS